MILSRSFKYLKYILLSQNRKGHGIHSPFVYDLVSRVFRNKTDPAFVINIENIRKRLVNDHRMLNITDLGAGSGKMKKNQRKVSEIARHSSVSPKYGRLLSNMAAEFGKTSIIEMGTSLGISTMYMALSSCRGRIDTIEGCSSVSEMARENFSEAEIENIYIHNSSFDDALPLIVNENRRPALIFIDGNHRREPLIKYFSYLAGLSDEKTVIVIDDINYSEEMEDAWSEIKKNPSITVSVDIFRMGIVFFRKGIPRSDYVIRY